MALTSALLGGDGQQYNPYGTAGFLGNSTFSGNVATNTLSPQTSQLTTGMGNQITSALGNMGYNPNTTFLPQQYQSIYGNYNSNVSSMYNSLQSAEQPQINQYLNSNLTNEYAKGTLASTAGGYQTYGADQAVNSQMSSNMAQAQQYSLGLANSQMQGATSTAQLGEEQAEFAPQLATGQVSSLYNNLLGTQSALTQQNATGLQGGLYSAEANQNPNAETSAESGLLNGLLGLNSSSGLLPSLLGLQTGSGESGLGALGGSAVSGLESLLGIGGGADDAVNSSLAAGNELSASADLSGSLASMDSGLQDVSSGLDSQLTDGLTLSSDSDLGLDSDDDLGLDDLDSIMDFNSAGGEAAGLEEAGGAASNGLSDIDLADPNLENVTAGLDDELDSQASQSLAGVQSSLGGAQALGSSALGLLEGVTRGGLVGDSQAAASAASLTNSAATDLGMSNTLLSGAADAAGYVAPALALYNEINSWQSGNTASDAIGGAETGASVGSLAGPLGTVIGGVIGAAAGAISSAFGGGEIDPETTMMDQYASAYDTNSGVANYLTNQQAFEVITGVMDGKNADSSPLEETFGRQGEGGFLTGMTNTINSAYSSGKITQGESAQQIYSSVVYPWMNSEGATIPPSSTDAQGQNYAGALQSAITTLIGGYTTGSLNWQTPLGVSGQTDINLSEYAGLTPQEQQAYTTATTSLGKYNSVYQGALTGFATNPMTGQQIFI